MAPRNYQKLGIPGRWIEDKSGIQPKVDPPHELAIDAMRCSIPGIPEVRTPELMASYRKLMNLRKALRRAERNK